MTGIWEDRLNNIAYGLTFDMPNADRLISKMNDMRDVLAKAAKEPGATGATADAAVDSLKTAAARAHFIAETTKAVKDSVSQAAQVQYDAQQAYLNLPDGELSQATINRINNTPDGGGVTVDEVSMCLVKNSRTLANVKAAVAQKREDAAQAAVKTASDDLDAITLPSGVIPKDGKQPGSGGGGGGGGGVPSTGGSTPPSYSYYPGSGSGGASGGAPIDWGQGSYPITPGGGYPGGGGGGYPGGPGGGYPGGPGGGYPGGPGGGSGWTPNPIGGPHLPPGGGLDPNGPGSGGTTWGGGGTGGGGYPGGGVPGGSGLLGGAVAGGGAALGGAALVGGARMTGGFGGAGAGGVGGVGVGGSVGGVGGSGGLLGGSGTGQGAAGRGAAGSAGSAAGGRGMMGAAGGAGQGGGRDRDRQEGRGLGGPIAPHLEDDEERGPRSASAGAGGRD